MTIYDESYPPSLWAAPPPPPIASVTAGTPGSFAPPEATVPANLTALRADPVVGNAGTNKPTTAWLTGQYVLTANASHNYWDGTGWQAGDAPVVVEEVDVASDEPEPEPEPEPEQTTT